MKLGKSVLTQATQTAKVKAKNIKPIKKPLEKEKPALVMEYWLLSVFWDEVSGKVIYNEERRKFTTPLSKKQATAYGNGLYFFIYCSDEEKKESKQRLLSKFTQHLEDQTKLLKRVLKSLLEVKP